MLIIARQIPVLVHQRHDYLAEAGDLRRFRHHRQFLKFCGLDLATYQSGSSGSNQALRSAMPAVAPSGLPPKSPFASATTVSEPNTSAISLRIATTPISSARR
jgi:hypothetical protein